MSVHHIPSPSLSHCSANQFISLCSAQYLGLRLAEKGRLRCFNCKKPGHISRECSEKALMCLKDSDIVLLGPLVVRFSGGVESISGLRCMQPLGFNY